MAGRHLRNPLVGKIYNRKILVVEVHMKNSLRDEIYMTNTLVCEIYTRNSLLTLREQYTGGLNLCEESLVGR